MMNLFRKKSIEKIQQEATLGLTDGHSANGLKRVLAFIVINVIISKRV